MTNHTSAERAEFEANCAALPEGVSWGEALTPEVVSHIRAASPATRAEPVAWQYKDKGRWWPALVNFHGWYIEQGFEMRPLFATPSAEPVAMVEGSPAHAMRGLWKLHEYYVDGKRVPPEEYIAWQAGIIESITKAKLPDTKYYDSSAEEDEQHEVNRAYVDGWNDCRGSILAIHSAEPVAVDPDELMHLSLRITGAWDAKQRAYAQAVLKLATPSVDAQAAVVVLTRDEIGTLVKARFGNMHPTFQDGFCRLVRDAIEANAIRRAAPAQPTALDKENGK